MSIGYASGRIASNRTLAAANSANSQFYARPRDWLNLPVLAPTDNKFVGLFAVTNNDSNFVAISATVTGGFTVDWGDGSAPVNVATGGTAQYQYNYATVSSATLTSRGYKQCIITVTPTTGGAAFTAINMQVRHSTVARSYNVPWLDVAVAGPSLTTVNVTGTSGIVALSMMEIFTMYSGTTNAQFMFQNMNSLAQVNLIGTSTISTSAQFMFSTCPKLVDVAPITFSATTPVTSAANMFSTCGSLVTAPMINNFSSVTTTASMFNACTKLLNVPLYNLAATTVTSMFSTCSSLTTIPQLNFSAATTSLNVFSSCANLISVPNLSFTSATSLTGLFSGCTNLTTVSLITSASLTNSASMFSGCNNLITVNAFTTSGVTNATSMFQNCLAITTIPAFNFPAVTDITSMFNGCRSLTNINITSINSNGGIITGSTFLNCASLSKMPTTGLGKTFSIINCNFSGAALNEVYTGLATTTGQTITVTGNWGTATDDPTIATAKGWTVTG